MAKTNEKVPNKGTNEDKTEVLNANNDKITEVETPETKTETVEELPIVETTPETTDAPPAPKSEEETTQEIVPDSQKSEAAPIAEIKEGAQGPLPVPSADTVLPWMVKYREDVKKHSLIDPTKTALEIAAQSIDRLFEDHDKTIMPKLTEPQIMEFLGEKAKGFNVNFVYTNDEKTTGYIEIKEFSKIIRCPEKGEFKFGIDYSKGK